MKRSTVLVGVIIVAAIGSYLAAANAVDSGDMQVCLYLPGLLEPAGH